MDQFGAVDTNVGQMDWPWWIVRALTLDAYGGHAAPPNFQGYYRRILQ